MADHSKEQVHFGCLPVNISDPDESLTNRYVISTLPVRHRHRVTT